MIRADEARKIYLATEECIERATNRLDAIIRAAAGQGLNMVYIEKYYCNIVDYCNVANRDIEHLLMNNNEFVAQIEELGYKVERCDYGCRIKW